MRTRLIVALLLVVSALLMACSPTTAAVDVAVSSARDDGAPVSATIGWAQAGDATAAGRFVLVAGTPEPGRGAGGSIKRPGSGPAEILKIRSHQAWVTDDGGINIVGEVVNVSDQVVDTLVYVAVSLTDDNGDLVEGDFGASLDRPAIAPGEVSSFWIPIWADELGDVSAEEIADYELHLQISEEPSLEVELDVVSSEAGEEDGVFVISGEVENQTDMTFDALFVYSTLYDADGEVVNATLDWAFPDEPLAPGDSASFEGYFYSHFEDADSFFVFVTGYAMGIGTADEGSVMRLTSADGVLEFVGHAGYLSEDGGITVLGEVENVTDETIDTVVQMEVQLFNEDGEAVLDPVTAFLDRPVLAPGEVSSFWVPISESELGDLAVEDISDYEVSAWISDRPTTGTELTVTNVDGGELDDIFLIEGSVLNETDEEFDWLAVYSTLYDEDGAVYNVTADWVGLDEPLAPGDEIDFEGYFAERFADADSFYVFVVGYSEDALWDYYEVPATLKAADDVLAVASHSGFVSEYGDLHIVGEAENISDRSIDTTVQVEVRLFDDEGEPIGDRAYTAVLDRPVIEPGAMSSFWVPVYADDLGDAALDDVSSYEVSLWISDQKSSEVEVLVDDLDAREEDGLFIIEGTALNQTDLEFTALRVYSTLYDADGDVINVTSDWVEFDEPWGPDEEVQFEGYFTENYEEADSFYVIVTGYGAEPEETGFVDPGQTFEIVSDSGFITESGSIAIVGEAVNVSDEVVDRLVVVEVKLYDGDGNEIGDGDLSAYLDRPVIEPGETSSFWVPIGADELGDYTVDDVEEYEISFWVMDEPSPDVELTVEDYDGGVERGVFYIRGTVSNPTNDEMAALTVYSTLYDEDGNVINATLDLIRLDDPLRPGEETEFEGYFPEHFEDAASYYVFVTGYTVDQIGQ